MTGNLNIRNDMKDTFKVYNNEAFICCVIMRILSSMNRIDISRLFLLTSIILTDKITSDEKLSNYSSLISYLNDNRKKVNLFPNMFEEFLSIILNSLTLLCESSNIELDGCNVVLIKDDFEAVDSKRLTNITNVLPAIMKITSSISVKQLYDILKITL